MLYNEIDPHAAEWLARLSAAGEIAPGDVDARSIVDLRPDDLAGRAQFHAFAGIGVWSRALRDAGVPDDFPVWTGSCPCQALSDAGLRKGFDDPRHLWPYWFALIRECRPPVIFGEQVASGLGLAWLDAVQTDLEGAGYAVGAADLCAAGVGAPHKRQRIFFVAVANADENRQQIEQLAQTAHAFAPYRDDADARGADGGLGNADVNRSARDAGALPGARGESAGQADRRVLDISLSPGATSGYWRDVEWVLCVDDKVRPAPPATPLVVDGPATEVVGSRARQVAAIGNAIVLPLAAEFIRAALGL